MKIFVTGSRGYIAQHAIGKLRREGLNVIEMSSHPERDQLEFSLLKPFAFDFARLQPGDILLLLAGVSSPDVCRTQPDLAREINVIGTGSVIEAALALGVRVLFFSSDTVYGFAEDERSEDAMLNPADAYSRMKGEIEDRFAAVIGIKILRLSYVFSRTDKFTAYLDGCARKGIHAEVFHPILRRVVYLEDLLDLLLLLCTSWEKAPARAINVCGPELLSRVDIAILYRNIVTPDLQFNVIEPPPGFFEARPQVINVSSRLFEQFLGRAPRSLSEAMRVEFRKED